MLHQIRCSVVTQSLSHAHQYGRMPNLLHEDHGAGAKGFLVTALVRRRAILVDHPTSSGLLVVHGLMAMKVRPVVIEQGLDN